jgi:transglutaminase-like putative cysteine protease
MKDTDFSVFLSETPSVQFKNDEFQLFLSQIESFEDKRSQAVAIYEHVRDAFMYDPYHLDLRPNALNSTAVIQKRRAWCVEKSLVAVACFRSMHIPARFGFGIVKNHLGVEKLAHYLQRDEIVFHGFVEVFLNERWIKCTPAFDPLICKLAQVPVLTWDGETDSLLQPYAGEEVFMEYIHFYGSFEDIPFELMHQEMYTYYPHLFRDPIDTRPFSFHFEPSLIFRS